MFDALILCFLVQVGVEEGLPAFRPPEGGLGSPVGKRVCLDAHSRQQIQQRLRRKAASISLDSSGPRPSFIWPLMQNPALNDLDFWAITNFVDHDPLFPDALLDYMGGMRTYDTTAGYNHAGTDFFLWPFGWEQMARDQVWVVAVAAGVIIGKDDGFFDRNCTLPPPNPIWNAVYIQHADGSVAWYGHLKNGSLTTKLIGDTVAAGEYLGVVGSSGVSTGPHLHLEIYDAGDNLNDPFAGPFNDMNDESWWQLQPDYVNSAIVRLMTHDDVPGILSFCPEDEIIHRANVFLPGERLHTSIWYRDQQQGQISSLSLIQPDGNPFAQWSHHIEEPHLAASFWHWYWDLPAGAEMGIWTLRAFFEGQLAEHYFVVGSCPSLYLDHLAEWPYNTDMKDLTRLIPCGQAGQ